MEFIAFISLVLIIWALVSIVNNWNDTSNSYYDKYDRYSNNHNNYTHSHPEDDFFKQEKLRKQLEYIQYLIIEDFKSAPYSDKIKTPKINGEVCWYYTFENNDSIKIEGRKIIYQKGTIINAYTVSQRIRSEFVALGNAINKKSKARFRTYNTNTKSSTVSDDPKRRRYDNLLEKIKLREDQLKNSSDSSLLNELNVYKKKAKEMKDKYGF